MKNWRFSKQEKMVLSSSDPDSSSVIAGRLDLVEPAQSWVQGGASLTCVCGL